LNQQGKGKSTYPERADLRDLDAQVMLDLLEEIRGKVEDSTSSYFIFRRPTQGDEGAWLSAYASNEFSEGGYVSATLDGMVVRTTIW
jgi:hypothetical protein